jgi:diadenosine tetraphosphate (Ap4A) HIT family hydrolase
MTPIHNCNICKELSGSGAAECGEDYQKIIRAGENILLSSAGFTAIPSVGPLGRTHAMVVPNRHVYSFAELDFSEIREASLLLYRMQNHIQRKFGERLFFFESGAGRLTAHSGGCISHAHIHCITESPGFFDRLSSEVLLVPAKEMNFSEADKEHGYIWFRNSEEANFICNRPLLPPQFLRYIYAQCAGSPSIWNWRRHANFTKIQEVISAYKGID